ncbi:uncharacterized protein [Primulina huaijiensis]|uniref:uncharacterized protein n=1 Tax=Primulina huaijiensis TaxID=1492673 RepID=UPI003CC6FF89
MADSVRQEILMITGFADGSLPFRYLGVPLAGARLKAVDYSILVDTIARRINAWPRNSLSYAGKIELIRSVVQGVECFWLSILPVPSCVIDSIQSICRKFVWPTKHPPIAWTSVCKPLEDGGLGLKDLKAWNKALLAKTLWKIHLKKDSLWIKWVQHFYRSSSDIWSWEVHKQDSPLLKKLLHLRDLLIGGFGTKEIAQQKICYWFASHQGMSRAYEYFVQSKGKWPWKIILSRHCILPKHRIILWLLAHQKLLTRDRMGFVEDKICMLCNEVDESNSHLFFKCRISKTIWDGVRHWLDMKKIMATPTSILKAFRETYRGKSTLDKMRVTTLAATVYNVWNLRNRVIFEGEKPKIEDTIRKIQIHTYRCVSNMIDIFS